MKDMLMKQTNIMLVWLVALVALGWFNLQVFQKEQLIAHGAPVLLELAPVDPRSLMQGDYMILRYAVSQQAAVAAPDELPRRGRLVVRTNGSGVASFVRFHAAGQPLASDEQLLAYHRRSSNSFEPIYLGAESFFFQEGQAETYAEAEYAELRVSETGESVLVGLRDGNQQPLGQPTPEPERINRRFQPQTTS